MDRGSHRMQTRGRENNYSSVCVGKQNKQKRVTFSFNPVLKTSWIYEDYFSGRFGDSDREFIGDGLRILKTTYKIISFCLQTTSGSLRTRLIRIFTAFILSGIGAFLVILSSGIGKRLT
jgi:hypothetical protein